MGQWHALNRGLAELVTSQNVGGLTIDFRFEQLPANFELESACKFAMRSNDASKCRLPLTTQTVCGLVRVPWPKRKSEGVHIRIGPDARITEEIPHSANGFARLQNRVGFSGKGSLQMVSSINT
jgi:hypothetical protein